MRARCLTLISILSITFTLTAWAEPLLGPCEVNDVGNDPSNAQFVETPVVCAGTLPIGDGDFYAFNAIAGETITVRYTVTHGTEAASRLIDPNGIDRSSTCTTAGSCVVTTAAAGRWITAVTYRSGLSGRYVMSVALGPPAPNPSCESSGDAPNSSSTARGVTPPLVCSGTIEPTGDTDWYSFLVGDGALIQAVLSRTSGGTMSMYLIGPKGVRACTQSSSTVCSVTNAEVGTWVVGIRTANANDMGGYALALSLFQPSEPVPSTCEPQDAAPSRGSATGLTSPAACTGRLADAADRDVFAFDAKGIASDTQAITIAVIPISTAVHDVLLTDPAGAPVPCTVQRAVVCSVRRTDAVGRWYLEVWRGAPGPYFIGLLVSNANLELISEQVTRTAEEATAPTTCEVADAGPDEVSAAALRWAIPSEDLAACRGSLLGGDVADVFTFPARTDGVTVRITLQPDALTDLTVHLTPPPSACAPSERQNGRCPSATSQLGRAGQPDYVEMTKRSGAKGGPWSISIGRVTGEGGYVLAVSLQAA